MRKILPHFSRNFAKIAKVKNLPYWLLKCDAEKGFIFTFYLHKNSCNLDMVLSLRLDLFLVTKSLELKNALSDATEVGLIFCKIMYNKFRFLLLSLVLWKRFISFLTVAWKDNFLVAVALSSDIWFNFACNFSVKDNSFVSFSITLTSWFSSEIVLP